MTKGRLAPACRADHYAIVMGHNNGATIDELCAKYRLKRSTINRIVKNYESSGLSLVIKGKGGPKALLSKDQLAKVLSYYNSSPKTHSDITKFVYYMFGVSISKFSVNHYLKRARQMHPELDTQFDGGSEGDQQSMSTSSASLSLSPTLDSRQIAAQSANQSTDFTDAMLKLMEAELMSEECEDSEVEYSFQSDL